MNTTDFKSTAKLIKISQMHNYLIAEKKPHLDAEKYIASSCSALLRPYLV